MAKKKKKRTFSAVKAVKSAARAQVGTPPATRREENPRREARQKHKKSLSDLLRDD